MHLIFQIPSSGSTVVKDVVYGNVEFKNEDIDDQVIVIIINLKHTK